MKRMFVCFMALLLLSVGISVNAQEAEATPETCQLTYDAMDFSNCSIEQLTEMFEELEKQHVMKFEEVELPKEILKGSSGVWNEVIIYEGASPEIQLIMSQLGIYDIAPDLWQDPFNVPNANVPYAVTNGYEYPGDLSTNSLCSQEAPCPFLVDVWNYRLTTADGQIPAFDWHCGADEDNESAETTTDEERTLSPGCAISVWEVGDAPIDVQSDFEAGFSITGRFFNGGLMVDEEGVVLAEDPPQALPLAISSLMSHAVYRMTNSFGESLDNCSRLEGCESVDLTVILTSGNEMLAKARTIYQKPA